MCMYSAGKHKCISTYLVGWDDRLVIKAGITLGRRWQGFCTRGGTLYHRHVAGDMPGVGWVRLESELHRWLNEHTTAAFANRDEAAPLLGYRGAGWTECYQAPTEAAYRDALAACVGIMREHPAGHCGSTVPAQMHGRTNERTYVEPHSRLHKSDLCNVRACTAKGMESSGEMSEANDLTPWPTFVAEQVRAMEERRRAAVTAARMSDHDVYRCECVTDDHEKPHTHAFPPATTEEAPDARA